MKAVVRSWFRSCGVGAGARTRSGSRACSSVLLVVVLACQPSSPAVSPDQPSTETRTPAPSEATGDTATHTESGSNAPSANADPGDGSWWSVPYPSVFDAATLAKTPARVSVKGNRFVDANGNTLVFHGVNISDPDKLSRDGHWTKRHFEAVASWGANVVRIPIHPAAWRGRGKDAYFALLDDAVQWANELDLYLIIDWHSIGNLRTGMFQHPMHQTSIQETNEFWRAVSHRYAGIPTVAFYELFNEPTTYNGTLGSMTWSEWKSLVEEMISIIAAHDGEVIPLVSGFNWAYDLRDALKQPINRKGIGYVSHPYPEKTTDPFEKNWDRDFGNVSKRYPLFATEIGYMPPNAPGAHVPVKDDGSYGKRITDYLDKKGASWTAWCFEPDWPPQLIADWNYTPTEAGNHFRSVMLEKAKIKATSQQLVAEAAAAKKAEEEQKAAQQKAEEEQKAAAKKALAEKNAAKQAAETQEVGAGPVTSTHSVAPKNATADSAAVNRPVAPPSPAGDSSPAKATTQSSTDHAKPTATAVVKNSSPTKAKIVAPAAPSSAQSQMPAADAPPAAPPK